MVTHIFLDLDGTLTDPKPGIINSFMYALKHMGHKVVDREALTRFIGPPLQDSFRSYLNTTEEDVIEAVRLYREYYADRGLFENRMYNGIDTLLAEWKADGKTLCVATCKPTVFARQVLEYFDLSRYFKFVAGSELDGKRGQKSEVIAYCIDRIGLTNKSTAVMIGDREHDIIGAKENGLRSIGVLYGYGSEQELSAHEPDHIVKNLPELRELILNA